MGSAGMENSNWIKAAGKYIQEWLKHQKVIDPLVPGYSVCLMCNGEIIFKLALGMAHLSKREPMSDLHRFRIASHSKTFTAVAIMKLVAAGKLDLADPISNWLSAFNKNPDKRYKCITVGDILFHTSGLSRDGPDASFWRSQINFPDQAEIIKLIEIDFLAIPDKGRFKYSNYGYAILSALIEAVSGIPYKEFISLEIIRPLRLSAINAEYDADDSPYVMGYSCASLDGEQIELDPTLNSGGYIGAVGFYSTAESLCHFYNAVCATDEKILDHKVKDLFFNTANEVPHSNGVYHYGMGMALERIDGFELAGHAGGFPGQMSKTTFSHKEKIVLSVLTNSYNARPDSLHKGIWHILRFFKDHYVPPPADVLLHGTFYDIAGPAIFTPIGNKIFVTNPMAGEPFKSFVLLEGLNSGLLYQITKDSGFGSCGEVVEVISGKDGVVDHVNYAGYPKYPHQAFCKQPIYKKTK